MAHPGRYVPDDTINKQVIIAIAMSSASIVVYLFDVPYLSLYFFIEFIFVFVEKQSAYMRVKLRIFLRFSNSIYRNYSVFFVYLCKLVLNVYI